jgi:RNA polymerase sigma factor (sigma-70 family)
MTETAVEDIRISTTVEDVENSYILDESSLNNVRKVQILMDELTPRQRQVFTLYYIEQRKYEDICDIMQMNYHSVRNLVHRGMLKLRAAVAV